MNEPMKQLITNLILAGTLLWSASVCANQCNLIYSVPVPKDELPPFVRWSVQKGLCNNYNHVGLPYCEFFDGQKLVDGSLKAGCAKPQDYKQFKTDLDKRLKEEAQAEQKRLYERQEREREEEARRNCKSGIVKDERGFYVNKTCNRPF